MENTKFAAVSTDVIKASVVDLAMSKELRTQELFNIAGSSAVYRSVIADPLKKMVVDKLAPASADADIINRAVDALGLGTVRYAMAEYAGIGSKRQLTKYITEQGIAEIGAYVVDSVF